MEKLTYRTRVTLSKLLDPCRTGCDWQTLADKLGLRTMMEGHIGDHSPTRLLLTYFEVNIDRADLGLHQSLAIGKHTYRSTCKILIYNKRTPSDEI